MPEFLTAFATPTAFIDLLMLIFLEIVLGIDNLVFIAIVTNRLPENKRHIGRRIGLMAALIMRILLLFSISWVMTLQAPLFTLDFIQLKGAPLEVTGRELILFVGGVYLIYKGITELIDKINLKEEKAEHGHPEAKSRQIGLVQAVLTIACMDIIFSLDSVITAVGVVGELPIMVAAVITAVIVMIVFADPIADFINDHPQIKILALTFILMVGVMLSTEALEIHIPKPYIYFAMVFSLAVDLIQMRYDKNLERMHDEIAAHNATSSCEGDSGSSGDTTAA